MKRFHILLAIAFGVIAIGSLSSCKDTDDDLYKDLRAELINQESTLREVLLTQKNELQQQINALKEQLNGMQSCNCADEMAKMSGKIKELSDALNALKNSKADQAEITRLQNLITELTNKVNTIQTGGAACECADKWADLQSTLTTIKDALNGKLSAADFNTFKTQLDQTVLDLTTRIAALETAKTEMQSAITTLEGTVQTIQTTLGEIDGKVTTIESTVLTISGDLATAQQDIVNIKELLKSIGVADPTDLTKIEERLGALEVFKSDYLDLLKKLNEQEADIEKVIEWYKKMIKMWGPNLEWLNNTGGGGDIIDEDPCGFDPEKYFTKEEIKALGYLTPAALADYVKSAALNDYIKSVDLKKLIAETLALELTEGEEPLKVKVDALKDKDTFELDTKVCTIQEAFDYMGKRIKNLEGKVKVLEDEVKAIKKNLEVINDRLDKMITSIVAQATVNPVFGSISLPIGMKSLVLTAIYGEPSAECWFPGTGGSIVGSYLTDAEVKGYKGEAIEKFPGNTIGADEEGMVPAGTVYATVNPSTVDMEGETLKLVDSKGEESGITLRPLEAANEQLTFGYTTRATDEEKANGFYKMQAVLDPKKADKNSLNISKADLSELKSSLKTFIEERQGLTSLVATVFKNISNTVKIPAYALEGSYEYTDSLGESHTAKVTSGYDIAALAIKPLSYNTLYNQKFNYEKWLPTMLQIEEINGAKYKGKLSFSFNKVNLTWSELTITINDMSLGADDKLTAEFTYTYPDTEGAYVDGASNVIFPNGMKTETGTATVDSEGMQDLVDAINNSVIAQIQTELNKVNDNIQVNISGVEDAINEMLGETAGTLNSQIGDVIDDITGTVNGYIGKANKILSRIESVYKKVLDKVCEPNLFLQPTMLVHTDNEALRLLSQDASVPTVLQGNGSGDMNIALYPTSYTAELLCPAYKKLVKVVEVTGGTAAQNAAAMNAANSATNMNKVLDGTVNSVEFRTNKEYKGLTYKVAYAAIDYHGYKTAKYFYIKVK